MDRAKEVNARQWAKSMPQLAPVMLSAEQFNQLATKDYLDQNFAKKDDLKSFATKDYLDEKLTHFATKDYLDEKLTHFATKDDMKKLATKRDLSFRFGQLNYKMDKSFKDVNNRLEKIETRLGQHEKEINELNLFTVDHSMRIKKLEFRAF